MFGSQNSCISPDILKNVILNKQKREFQVLIANDEKIQLDIMSFQFENSLKCDVDKAQNGFEAYEFVNKKFNSDPQKFYDLIILDLQMPISNGYETCEKILNLFNQERMFNHKERLLLIDESPKKWEKNQIYKINSLQLKLPLLVACSSSIKTPELDSKLQ